MPAFQLPTLPYVFVYVNLFIFNEIGVVKKKKQIPLIERLIVIYHILGWINSPKHIGMYHFNSLGGGIFLRWLSDLLMLGLNLPLQAIPQLPLILWTHLYYCMYCI